MNENVFIPKVEALKTHEFMVVLVDLITDSYEVLTFTVEAYGPMDAYNLALHRAWNIIKTTEGYENKIIRHITMDIDNYKKGNNMAELLIFSIFLLYFAFIDGIWQIILKIKKGVKQHGTKNEGCSTNAGTTSNGKGYKAN